MAIKQAMKDERAPNLSHLFNWGLEVSDFSKLFFISGHGALLPDFQVVCPGDPEGQTRFIFSQIQDYLAENGYGLEDLVQIKLTITKDVTDEQFEAVTNVYADFMKDIEVKPTGGTMRVVDRLAFPEMMVEFEFLAAK